MHRLRHTAITDQLATTYGSLICSISFPRLRLTQHTLPSHKHGSIDPVLYRRKFGDWVGGRPAAYSVYNTNQVGYLRKLIQKVKTWCSLRFAAGMTLTGFTPIFAERGFFEPRLRGRVILAFGHVPCTSRCARERND